jgi:hypothetical protein
MDPEKPSPIVGYVRMYQFVWLVEGDPSRRKFLTPQEAAEYGFSNIWVTP